jgi:ethanolamine utilization microcompartment shell protein EutS
MIFTLKTGETCKIYIDLAMKNGDLTIFYFWQVDLGLSEHGGYLDTIK